MKKSYTKKRITIDKFLSKLDRNLNEFELKPNVAKNCYNIKVVEGVLCSGNGFEKLSLPDTKEEGSTVKEFLTIEGVTFKKIWRYKYYSDTNQDYEYILIALSTDNKIYYLDMFGYGPIIVPVNQFNFTSEPTALSFRVEGKDVMGFCSPTDNFTVWYCDEDSDVLIVDTAGRLHNKKNLMDELAKINRVINRELPGASRETLLVLDATTGQNAVIQAKEFRSAADITGLVLTKLDGSAKGGIVFSIKRELGLPIKYIGVGEKADDMQPFDVKEFVKALFE